MSNMIAFLEKMGQDARLRHASQSDMELALAHSQIDPELQAAILAKDQLRLETLLEGANIVCCMINPDVNIEDKPDVGDEDEDELASSSESENKKLARGRAPRTRSSAAA